MKKTLLLGLACFMSVSLLACGSKGQDNVQNDIKIYTRDSSSGTREAFEKGVDVEGALSKDAIEVTSNDDMAAKVGMDINGIGYTSLSTDFEKNGVKPLSFEGIEANEQTVIDGSYGLQRPFNFVTRNEKDYESDDKKQLIQAFLDFLQNSREGMAVVKKAGGEVDVTKASPWEELAVKYPVLKKDNTHITITTCGSTSVEKSVKAALEAFSPLAGNVAFVMNQNGSSDAVPRVLGSEKDGPNKADIGFASREFKAEEDTSKAMLKGTYCIDAVVAIVHKDNAIKNITKTQLHDIFTGNIKQWDNVK